MAVVDATVVVVGVEERDLEAGAAEELGEAEEGLDVTLRRKRKKEDMMLMIITITIRLLHRNATDHKFPYVFTPKPYSKYI